MRRMLTAKLRDSSGVLNRFTGVLSRRQVNINSISVGPTEVKGISRVTVIIEVESLDEVDLITKQLNRLVDVVRVKDITDIPHLEREVLLVKISAPASKRAEILAIIQPFRASVVTWPHIPSPFKSLVMPTKLKPCSELSSLMASKIWPGQGQLVSVVTDPLRK